MPFEPMTTLLRNHTQLISVLERKSNYTIDKIPYILLFEEYQTREACPRPLLRNYVGTGQGSDKGGEGNHAVLIPVLPSPY